MDCVTFSRKEPSLNFVCGDLLVVCCLWSVVRYTLVVRLILIHNLPHTTNNQHPLPKPFLQYLIHQLRIGLAFGFLHDLPDEKSH